MIIDDIEKDKKIKEVFLLLVVGGFLILNIGNLSSVVFSGFELLRAVNNWNDILIFWCAYVSTFILYILLLVIFTNRILQRFKADQFNFSRSILMSFLVSIFLHVIAYMIREIDQFVSHNLNDGQGFIYSQSYIVIIDKYAYILSMLKTLLTMLIFYLIVRKKLYRSDKRGSE